MNRSPGSVPAQSWRNDAQPVQLVPTPSTSSSKPRPIPQSKSSFRRQNEKWLPNGIKRAATFATFAEPQRSEFHHHHSQRSQPERDDTDLQEKRDQDRDETVLDVEQHAPSQLSSSVSSSRAGATAGPSDDLSKPNLNPTRTMSSSMQVLAETQPLPSPPTPSYIPLSAVRSNEPLTHKALDFTTVTARTSSSNDVSRPGGRAVTGGIRRIASEGFTRAQKFHVSLPPANMGETDHDEETAVCDDRPRVSTSATSDQGPGAGMSQDGRAVGQALQNSVRPERSVSRGRTKVDKSIEATVKKPEAGTYVRSRKASHMMGIFGDRSESNRRALKPQETEQAAPKEPSNVRGRTSSLSSAPQQIDVRSPSTTHEPRPDSDRPEVRQDANRLAEPCSPVSTEILPSDLAVTVLPAHDSRSRQHESVQPTKQADALSVDGREADPKSPAVLRKRASTPGASTDMPEQEPVQLPPSLKSAKDEDEEEHISAAVYYPHEGPSIDEIEDFDSHEETTNKPVSRNSSVSAQSAGSMTSQEEQDTATVQSEHIDISVESKNERSVFYGSYQSQQFRDDLRDHIDDEDNSRTPRMPPADDSLDLQPLVTSESEIDSSDELASTSQTDDAATTPTQTAPLTRRRLRAGTVAKPRTAVILEPYKHQVGGHSTIFRFSRRAVCKQLNNRENEFYERIERTHPEMLKFLPRYIGVLNVTFSKGPKNTQQSSSPESKTQEDGNDNNEKARLESQSDGAGNRATGSGAGNASSATAHPRVVSHSQDLGSIPQVLLNQNKHIIPSEYFGLPERPKSADPQHFRHHSHEGGKRCSLLSSELAREKNGDERTRPSPPEHSPSWGTTSVNEGLRDKVLKEVFGPPPIKHKKRGHGHNTLPQLKGSPEHRRVQLSSKTFELGKTEVPKEPRRGLSMDDSDVVSDTPRAEEKTDRRVPPNLKEHYSSSASAFDEFRHKLKNIKTDDPSSVNAVDDGRPAVRRRHSGMGLRRRRRSVSGTERPDLEYYEDDALSAMKEAEVFAMDEDDKHVLVEKDELSPKKILAADVKSVTQLEENKFLVRTDVDGASETTEEVLVYDDFPVNPKDAQSSSNADSRVAYFILLEDLTAGMGRPCVLDLKMGTRQYGVEANQKKMDSQRRKCRTTTSQQLGVRVCGMQTFNKARGESQYEDKYFGRGLSEGREFRQALVRFLYDGVSYDSVARHIPAILHKLSKLESMVRRLPGYRFYASSLLMYYDAEPEQSREFLEVQKNGGDLPAQKRSQGKVWPHAVEVKLVDFANCVTAEDPLPLGAEAPPAHPLDIDRGYLRGLKSLKIYFGRILSDINQGRCGRIAKELGNDGPGKEHNRTEEGHDEDEAEALDDMPTVTADDDEGEVSF